MPVNLTGSTIASSYSQLLHVDGGPTSTEKVVYSGVGVATSLKLGTLSASIANINFTGNTIQAASGNLTIGSNVAFSNQSNARTALGLGTMATQNSNNVTITGGTINATTFGSNVAFSNQSNARTALGLGTMATQNSNNVTITGGTINATTLTEGTAPVVVQTDIGTAPNQVPINAYLGSMAYLDTDSIVITGGSISGVTFSGSFSGMTLVESVTLTGTTTTNGGNLRMAGNTLSSTNTDGNIDLTPNGTGEVNIAKVDIDGGSIDGTPIGATSVSTVKGSTVLATIGAGYAAGAGGTVTQATNKSTGVTLNQACGRITMNGAQLNRNTGVTFTLTNSEIAATDVVIVNIASGATANSYTVGVDEVSAGSCKIHLHNHTTGTDLSDTVVLNFVVIKGVHT